MPCEIRWSSRAIRDIDRLADFLKSKNPSAIQQAIAKIRDGVSTIATMPNIGVAIPDGGGRREYFVSFGRGSYVIRYRQKGDIVAILRIFHSREDR